LTWTEVARAASEGRVPIVPIGTLEDHGYHLPIDTDVTLVEAICRGAAERLPAQTVLLPPIVHGPPLLPLPTDEDCGQPLGSSALCR
jgi:creatinine amidohydrolase